MNSPSHHMLMLEGLYCPRRKRLLRWHQHELKPLVYYQQNGMCKAYFTNFILCPLQSTNHRYLTGLQSAFFPALESDWNEWSEALFATGCWLHAFQSVVEQEEGRILQMWVTLPYPWTGFHVRDNRQQALERWIDKFITRWRKQTNISSVHLCGFVWGREMIPEADSELVRYTNAIIHHYNLQSLWLPNYRSSCVADTGKLGFDHVAVFSNYTGNRAYPSEWLHLTAQYTGLNRFGMQFVFGRGPRFSPSHIHSYMKAMQKYESYGGRGPYVYRLIHRSLYECYLRKLALYDRIYHLLQSSESRRRLK